MSQGSLNIKHIFEHENFISCSMKVPEMAKVEWFESPRSKTGIRRQVENFIYIQETFLKELKLANVSELKSKT